MRRWACRLWSFPYRWQPLNFSRPFALEFAPLGRRDFPLYDLALACGEAGGTLPCALNAADEVAVNAFLNGEIAFTDIYAAVEGVISATEREEAESFEQLCAVDGEARLKAREIIKNLKK